MRLEPLQRSFRVTPGRPFDLDVEVFNTAEVIDGITARVIGLDPAWVSAQPLQLALFPQTSGRIKLNVRIPPEFPAGTHVITVETVSSVPGGTPAHAEITLDVEQVRQANLVVAPAVVTARHEAQFDVVCDNTGNTPLRVALSARDPSRAVRFEALERTLDVPPGGTVGTKLRVSARRRVFGANISHPLLLTAESPEAGLELEATGTFTQRPLIPRGPITFAILAAIVALWALAMLFGLGRVLSSDPLTKAAPASFFASTAGAGSATPAGAIPKHGGSSAISGQISGTVKATTTNKGVGRITVQAVRDTRRGPVVVASAATGDDGTYTVEGLLPGRYKLHFLADGYKDAWYPAATAESSAKPVNVAGQTATKGVNVTITGNDGIITGQVTTGQSTSAVPVAISVTAQQGHAPPRSAATAVPPNTSGTFTIPDVPTPGSYKLTFTAPGYQPTTITEEIGGGATLTTNTVRLSAGPGSITGTVTDGTKALGGVTITATGGDTSLSSATPTIGAVGQYSLTGLPTPGTYLLTFTKQGFGSQTIAVDLSGGENKTGLDVDLSQGVGTVTGTVKGPSGPLGNVTITVNGGPAAVVTQSFTTGAVGSYVVSGLQAPGTYTVTFSLAGYQSQTLPVALDASGAAGGVDATLQPTLGTLRGTVHGPPAGSVTVSLTDGATVQTTKTVTSPAGSYQFVGLPAGTYAVTFSATGYNPQTILVTLAPGEAKTGQDVTLNPTSSP